MINRDNYEEFFLMYVDGELSATDKEMVDGFVQQNLDLKDELAMLQQAVLLPEAEIVFVDKNTLFKHIGNEITTANYEEKFLLYFDNELTAEDKTDVETFVLQHPELQNDFTLLQQTKLDIETITCPNKEALYKEEKNRKVVYMRWFTMAAAAVVIGLIAMVYFVIPTNKNSNDIRIATSIITPKKQSIVTAPNIEKTQPITELITKQNAAITAVNTTKKAANRTSTVANNAIVKDVVKETIVRPSYKPNATEFLQDATKKVDKNEAIVVTNNLLDRTTNSIIDQPATLPAVANALTANTKVSTTTVQQVVYKELDTNTDEKSLLVGSIEINKDKLRGLLRKASKLFGNKQKSDDADAKSTFALNK